MRRSSTVSSATVSVSIPSSSFVSAVTVDAVDFVSAGAALAAAPEPSRAMMNSFRSVGRLFTASATMSLRRGSRCARIHSHASSGGVVDIARDR